MSARQILTPDLAAPVPVASGEVVALPCGRGWGTRATLVCAGPYTVQGYAHPAPDIARPLAGGDLAVSEARTVTFELRGPDSPRREVV